MLGVAAARGVGLLVGRTLGLQLLTAGVTVLLARLLTPADYGLFAIALAAQILGQRAAELGLPSALVRMEEDPSPELQSAVLGATLALSGAVFVAFAITAFALLPALGASSKTLEVVAVALAAMPIYAARANPVLLMERKLKFGAVAIVETADTVAFNAFALIAAIVGLGAFSLAGAVPAGGAAGLAAAWAIQPAARRPSLELAMVRPLAGFGLKVSVLQGIYLIKDLGFVVLLSAIGGASIAGFYAMAKRLFSFPVALASAVGRVSYPALSRDPELRPGRAARISTISALAAGLPLALVAGAAQPLIAVLLGDRWLPTTDIVLIGSVGMMVVASASATMISFALAEGQPGPTISSALIETLLLCGLAAALIGSIDETGVGIALAVSNLVGALVLAWATHPELRRSLLAVTKSTAIAAVAVGAAQILGVSNDVGGLLLALAVTAAVWFALEALFSRPELGELARFARPLLRRARLA